MKRPISILCISDLHYEEGNMNAINRLHSDYNNFVNQNEEGVQNKRWHPDYIVVAGDVVNHNSHDYSKPAGCIERLRSDFGIDKSHVIIVPGNHDKKIKRCTKIKTLDKNKEIFDNFCREEGTNKQEFCKIYSSRFEEYISFCKDYFDLKKDENYEYLAPALLDSSINCLSGVKVFKEDSLCFLIVNTEWTYVSKIPFFTRFLKNKLTNHQTVYEKCQLCAPLIKDAYDLIKEKYPHYTVITVMHRGFEDLLWEENNLLDPMSINAIGYIKDMSDIIFTGHDHTIKTDPPTLINNRIQHFKLGSVGRKEVSTTEHIRTASIIRFSPTDSKIEMMHLVYKKQPNNKCEWEFQPHDTFYPLYSKFDRNKPLPIQLSNLTLIKAQSTNKVDIQKAINAYFEPKGNVRLHIVEANSETIECDLNKIDFDEKGIHYIVVYYLHHVHCFEATKELETQRYISNVIEDYTNNHIESIICNRLIIKETIIQVPIFSFKEEKIPFEEEKTLAGNKKSRIFAARL